MGLASWGGEALSRNSRFDERFNRGASVGKMGLDLPLAPFESGVFESVVEREEERD